MNSERLTYKCLSKEDYEYFYRIYSDPDTMQYTYMDAFETREEAKKNFDEVLKHQEEQKQEMEYLVFTKETRECIGIVDYEILKQTDFGGIYEIGYFILPGFWGKGYATEMAEAMIGHLFQHYNIHKIAASCNRENAASEKIMVKLGMKKEGVIRKKRYKNGIWEDEVRYGILREEWNH